MDELIMIAQANLSKSFAFMPSLFLEISIDNAILFLLLDMHAL